MKSIIVKIALIIVSAFGLAITRAEGFFGFTLSKRTDNDGDHYKENRDKTLDCSCGVTGNRNHSLPFPWHVLISHDPSDTMRGSRSTTKMNSGTVDQKKYCSGTIINSKIILTSVSCILSLGVPEIAGDATKGIILQEECVYKSDELRVLLLANGRTFFGVEKLFYHPKYLYHLGVQSKTDYDIALLALKTELNFVDSSTSPVPVCLPRQPTASEKLEGIKVVFSHVLPASNNSTLVANVIKEVHSSFTYPLKRCRVNAETKWISNRFLCSEADPFGAKLYTEIGTALLAENEGTFTQLGLISWKTYFPLLNNRKPLLLSTNVANFLPKIDEFSNKNNAKWCKNDHSPRLPKDRWTNGTPSDINDQNSADGKEPWIGTTSKFRNVRSDCVCGRQNSMASLGRIQGGKETTKYEYGWMVQLLGTHGKTTQLCGGSIINSRIILTAAHCVYSDSHNGVLKESDKILPKNMQVRIQRHGGPNERDDHSRILKVEAVIPHPKYSLQYIDNDVALLVLRKPIDFQKLSGKVTPICFPMTNESLEVDGRTDAKIIGWGRTAALKKGSHALALQELTVNVASRDNCLAILNEYKKAMAYYRVMADERKLCAGTFSKPRDYKDPAQGDSGGPLFMPIVPSSRNMIQIGVASMITMNDDQKFLKSEVKTVTFYAKTQSYVEFVDYHSLIADASWCIRR